MIPVTQSSDQQPPFHSSGSPDIDAIQHKVATSPTNKDNYRRRALLLCMWLGALQQQGANTRPFMSVDQRYHPLEARIARASDAERVLLLPEWTALIDEGYRVMETIQSRLVEQGPIAIPSEGDALNFPDGGDMEAEWPMFQGDIHHTGYTEAPGSRYGRGVWKFPVGLGWYARPVVRDGQIYVASPGMHDEIFENKCYHIADDYHKLYDLCGTAAEKRLQDMLVGAIKNADCPEEQFERLGLNL